MAATPPPGYTNPPTDLPIRGDRATFSNRVDAWVTWFSKVILTQLGAMIANAYANALDAFNSANIATAQANAAIAAVGITAWVSGTTYTAGDMRYSPLNFQTYRRTTNGSGTTDPSLDAANWAPPVQLGLRGYVVASDPAVPTTIVFPNGINLVEFEMVDGGQSSGSTTSTSQSSPAGRGGNGGKGSFVPTAGVSYTLAPGAGGVGGGANSNVAPVSGGASTISGTGLTTITSANAAVKVAGGIPNAVSGNNLPLGGASMLAVTGSTGLDRPGGGGQSTGGNAPATPGVAGVIILRY